MKTLVLTVRGNIPSLKNNKRILINRSTGKPFIASSKDAKKWMRDHVLIFRAERNAQGIASPFTRCAISIVCRDTSKRKYDLDNKINTILDALKKAGVIVDDDRFCVCDIHIINDPEPTETSVVICVTGDIAWSCRQLSPA